MSFPTSRRHILLRRLGAMCGALVMTFSGVAAIVGFQVAGSARAGATGSLTPTISNLPTSAIPGGSFTPAVSTSSSGVTSVTSSTPSICSVNQNGSVSYLAAGTCSLTSHVTSQTSIAYFSRENDGAKGVAVDASGNVYVTDYDRVVEVASDGTQTTIGSGFNYPTGVAVGGAGTVYVGDYGNNRVEKIAPTGTQATFGPGFHYPRGVAIDASGNVYVADHGNNQVLKVTPAIDGASQSFVIQPTISNIPSSATVGGTFTPSVSEGTSTGITSVTSSTPSVCSVN